VEATKHGIFLNKPEIAALLVFTGDGDAYSVVHFQVGGSGKLKVGATDGRKSVECTAKATDAVQGEWAVDREFLDKRRRAMDGATELMRLEIGAGGSVLRIALVSKENGDEKEGSKWSRDAASTQISLSKIEKDLKAPRSRDHQGSWCAFDPDEVSRCLRRLKIATDNCPITEWPPKAPDQLKHYECSGNGGRWVAAFKPVDVVAPGDRSDEPEDEDEGAPGRNDRQAKLDLADRAKAKAKGDDGGIVDDDYKPEGAPPKLATEKKRKAKKS
jgi:hypothetical protein